MLKTFLMLCILPICIAYSCAIQADWRDKLKEAAQIVEEQKSDKPNQKEVAQGLKQALENGSDKAVTTLGKTDGFYKDPSVKILMPPELLKVDQTLRKIGQNKLADEFIQTMNRAAELAVKTTLNIFVDAIKKMTIIDALTILAGSDDAATRYFERTEGSRLHGTIKPIVTDATKTVGVTKVYKKIRNRLRFVAPSLTNNLPELDEYITQKTMDGLFLKIAEEEGRIRKDPVARTTDLLRRVFG
ncbi:MAG: DUF4197 domain-containing protein [Gammaproteobacteria bacterium]|nr:DUF4197 domain-containing protein [Gammaproteobacteria bacterium]